MSYLPSPSLCGALLGAAAALGAWLVGLGLPLGRRVDLAARVAPYLGDGRLRRRAAAGPSPAGRSWSVGRPGLVVAAGLGRPGDRDRLRRRLELAGAAPDLARFRAEQVVCGTAGLAAGAAVAATPVVAGAPGVLPVALVAGGALAGVVTRDRLLTHRIRGREERLLAELPTVADLLALGVVAGQGPVGALERVVATCRGELAAELGRCLAAVRGGCTLVAALDALAGRTGVPALARFLDGVSVAVERGTPLAEVLHAQAADVRERRRAALVESGGRREIALLVPLVFLALPVTVLVAVYPVLVAVYPVLVALDLGR